MRRKRCPEGRIGRDIVISIVVERLRNVGSEQGKKCKTHNVPARDDSGMGTGSRCRPVADSIEGAADVQSLPSCITVSTSNHFLLLCRFGKQGGGRPSGSKLREVRGQSKWAVTSGLIPGCLTSVDIFLSPRHRYFH